jgi:hypothetical protein
VGPVAEGVAYAVLTVKIPTHVAAVCDIQRCVVDAGGTVPVYAAGKPFVCPGCCPGHCIRRRPKAAGASVVAVCGVAVAVDAGVAV